MGFLYPGLHPDGALHHGEEVSNEVVNHAEIRKIEPRLLAREQVLTLEQDAPWATIQVTGRTVHPATTAATAAGPAA